MIKQKTIDRFDKIPKTKKYTITDDNETTFSAHELTEKNRNGYIFC